MRKQRQLPTQKQRQLPTHKTCIQALTVLLDRRTTRARTIPHGHGAAGYNFGEESKPVGIELNSFTL